MHSHLKAQNGALREIYDGTALKENEVTKAEMAARMRTSRAAVDRLLDASNSSVTLNTLGKAARALGRKIKIELLPA